jgi:hypothetical protein
MEFDIKLIFVGLIAGIAVPLVLMIFVFSSTIYGFMDVIVFILLGIMTFFGLVMAGALTSEKAFPIKVMIFERRASGHAIVFDRARRVKGQQEGINAYLLKDRRAHTKPIDFKYLYTGRKGQIYLFLNMPQANEYHPIHMKDAELITSPENAKYWYAVQLRRNHERWTKKSGWEKFMPIAMPIAVGFIIVFMLYVFLVQMGGVMGQIGGISNSLGEVTQQVANLVGKVEPLIGNTGLTPTSGLPGGIPPPQPPV